MTSANITLQAFPKLFVEFRRIWNFASQKNSHPMTKASPTLVAGSMEKKSFELMPSSASDAANTPTWRYMYGGTNSSFVLFGLCACYAVVMEI